MTFQLGKTKSSEDETVREETFRRWREASLKSDATAADVEAVKVDSMKAVEWPDPRATIALTQAVEESVQPEEISRPDNVELLQKSATSRLAQFVSSGLNATGLLGSTHKAAPKLAVKSIVHPAEEAIRLVPRAPKDSELESRTAIVQASVSVEEEIKQRFGSNIRSALGPGTIIEGTFSFDTPVCIEGTLIGEVRSNSVLIVGAQATVSAKVKVGSLIVMGIVKGDVEADELVEIKSGVVEGESVVTSGNFLIDSESRLKSALDSISREHQHGT